MFEIMSSSVAMTADEVARRLNLHAGYTYRVLRCITASGTLKETDDGFVITPKGMLLKKDNIPSVRYGILVKQKQRHDVNLMPP